VYSELGYALPYLKKVYIEGKWLFLFLNIMEILAILLLELRPSTSGFLDILVSFPRLVCQTNVPNPLLRKRKIPSITGNRIQYLEVPVGDDKVMDIPDF
jgi:hypothetical protein